MNASESATVDRDRWQRHFTETIISGDRAEVAAATEAAVAAIARGNGEAAAKAAGRAAATAYRKTRRFPGAGADPARPAGPAGTPANDPAGWSGQLATRLFAIPAQWGWRAAAPPAAPTPAPELAPAARPAWVEPPRPDAGHLRRARSAAVTKLVWRLAFSMLLVFAFLAFREAIEQEVLGLGEDAASVFQVAILVGGGLLAIGVVRGVTRVTSASRAIQAFEQPYRALRTSEWQRYEQALAEWQAAVARHQAIVADHPRRRPDGPLWYPVRPAAEPTRVDVVGGDPRRHGWASLLVTLGSSLLAGGERVMLLDFTGEDVGGGLLAVAGANGLSTRRVDLADAMFEVTLLHGLSGEEVAEALGYALTGGQAAGDQRYERAFLTDLVRRVVGCLDGAVSFGRIAAAIDVLRQATAPAGLAAGEVSRLADHIGELGQDEWTARQMRFAASQLRVLDEVATIEGLPPEKVDVTPLWMADRLLLVTTEGGRDDRKELLDRLLVQLAQRELERGTGIDGTLVVADAGHLGAGALQMLSDHARQAGVRLVLMVAQPQGDLEKTLGTGGVVCVMKMYNHRDAAVAADFIGRDHTFVVSQLTRQVGKTLTDGGGDNFSAATTQGTSAKPGLLRERGRTRDLSESRGHTWTGVRSWSLADNVSSSQTSTRVYELTVDPQQILGLPETAFVLVDNTGPGRQVVMADGNPGICLLDRVATTAAEGM